MVIWSISEGEVYNLSSWYVGFDDLGRITIKSTNSNSSALEEEIEEGLREGKKIEEFLKPHEALVGYADPDRKLCRLYAIPKICSMSRNMFGDKI